MLILLLENTSYNFNNYLGFKSLIPNYKIGMLFLLLTGSFVEFKEK